MRRTWMVRGSHATGKNSPDNREGAESTGARKLSIHFSPAQPFTFLRITVAHQEECAQ